MKRKNKRRVNNAKCASQRVPHEKRERKYLKKKVHKKVKTEDAANKLDFRANSED
jgi:hypothetical protein